MDGNQTNQTESKGTRGGVRAGAGRPSIIRRAIQQSKGYRVDPLYAAQILSFVIDERKAWQRVFNSADDRVILQGLMFLVSMRDGKPAQQINVTSTNVNLNLSDVERARSIAREIRGEFGPTLDATELDTPRLGTSEDEVKSDNPYSVLPRKNGEDIMLRDGEGGKKDGVAGKGLED